LKFGRLACQIEGLFPGGDPSVELGFFDGVQDRAESRAGCKAHGNEVVARQQARRPDYLWRSLGEESIHELIVFQVPVARKAVQAV